MTNPSRSSHFCERRQRIRGEVELGRRLVGGARILLGARMDSKQLTWNRELDRVRYGEVIGVSQEENKMVEEQELTWGRVGR